MKKIIALVCMLNLILISCKKASLSEISSSSSALIPVNDIDDKIHQALLSTGSFNWNEASPQLIWSALAQSDHVLSVGFSINGFIVDESNISQIDIHDQEWQKAKQHLLEDILQSEKALHPEMEMKDLQPWEEEVLPVVDVYVRNPRTIQLLRDRSNIRYAEPLGYEPGGVGMNKAIENETDHALTSSSGCGSNVAAGGLQSLSDYLNILPNASQSWNMSYHGIQKAWTKSSGSGIKIFIIDTGGEFDQENLGSTFNQGYSRNRTVEKIVTLPQDRFLGIPIGSVETPDDGCGHGTAMAGACAGPRGTDGNTVGVAYNCNLVTCRAAADVYLDESRESKGVADAFTNAANRADVRIISMSLGRLTNSSQITDAILYAYGKGKMIFCAAGTSFSWTSGWAGVIFPASLSQVNAVTGVKASNFNNTCDDCHSGSATDFTVVMEKSAGAEHPLSLAMYGDVPSTVGGSSVATASTAGIAALIWSRFPSWSRDQVLNKMIQSSSNYPLRNVSLGWGMVNADVATN
jgi:subtilisin family serine protease